MKKRVLGFGLVFALVTVIGVAWAGEGHDHGSPSAAEKMAMVKAEMMKCVVCKNIGVHFDELGPVMTMDVAMLDDGVAILHGVSDPAKAALFHEACQATEKAGEASMSLTDEQAKTQLCPFCQELRGIMQAGGKMSSGQTKTGDLMVVTSSDPAVKARIDAWGKQCAMMSATM